MSKVMTNNGTRTGYFAPVDVIVMDEALVQRRAKVRGTMVERAARGARCRRVLSTRSP